MTRTCGDELVGAADRRRVDDELVDPGVDGIHRVRHVVEGGTGAEHGRQRRGGGLLAERQVAHDREIIDAEIAALAKLRPGKNTDRSLTGSIYQLTIDASYFEDPVSSLLEACDLLQARLSRTPHVKRTPAFSDQALALLMATRP